MTRGGYYQIQDPLDTLPHLCVADYRVDIFVTTNGDSCGCTSSRRELSAKSVLVFSAKRESPLGFHPSCLINLGIDPIAVIVFTTDVVN